MMGRATWIFLLAIIVTLLITLGKFYEILKWKSIKLTVPELTIRDVYLDWKDNISEGVVHYKEITPVKYGAKLDILLLHGMRFSSSHWLQINTLHILALHGYHVIALDLPGFGKSSYKLTGADLERSRVEFLEKFVEKTRLDLLVIVSPSASGLYSLPYLAASKPARGFVAIAVTGTAEISQTDFQHFPLTLIIRGSRDVNLGVTSMNALSKNVPHNAVEVVEEAGHACYLDKPDKFHDLLLKFLPSTMRRP